MDNPHVWGLSIPKNPLDMQGADQKFFLIGPLHLSLLRRC
jgi:hypothetical protein